MSNSILWALIIRDHNRTTKLTMWGQVVGDMWAKTHWGAQGGCPALPGEIKLLTSVRKRELYAHIKRGHNYHPKLNSIRLSPWSCQLVNETIVWVRIVTLSKIYLLNFYNFFFPIYFITVCKHLLLLLHGILCHYIDSSHICPTSALGVRTYLILNWVVGFLCAAILAEFSLLNLFPTTSWLTDDWDEAEAADSVEYWRFAMLFGCL